MARRLAQPKERLSDEPRISRSLDEEGWRKGHLSRGLRHASLQRTSLHALNWYSSGAYYAF
jgi:hypothetical protein